MVDFENNVNIVISTLERNRYGPRAVSIARKCFEELSVAYNEKPDQKYSTDFALHWYETVRIAKEYKQPYKMNIARLDDVYKFGHVLGKHIKIYPHPSESFQCIINEYMELIEQSGAYTQAHIKNIRHVVTQFCSFIQYKGAKGPEEINYHYIDDYDSFMRESSKVFYINEGLVVGFLKYLGVKWKSKTGFSLYMHYAESNRISSLSALSDTVREHIEDAQEKEGGLTALGFYETIGGFLDCLKEQSYSQRVLGYAKYSLTILFLFLDRSELCYERKIVEFWFQEEGERIFKTSKLEARRIYELYDDYLKEGNIDTGRWWKHRETWFDALPKWCREQVDSFIAVKEKEGWATSTIKMYRTCATVFCRFLASSGIDSFDELTAAMVKNFNIHDDGHRTPEAKNAYNSRIRNFLIYLEINDIIAKGIHQSLPRSAAGQENIVEVLSDDDSSTIDEYCRNASSPLQIRDAAMLQILMETALRACDVAALEASDIDWKQMGIRIIQKKTRVGHIHPLSAKTMNYIFRYIKEVRKPDTGHTKIFLKLKAPYRPVGRSTCRDALIRAGVSGRTHAARRTYATALLKSGATIVETAEMLGHSDTSSVHKYTLLDSERMRLCPLSLSETGLLLEGRYHHG